MTNIEYTNKSMNNSFVTSELADCFSQTAEIILPPQFPNDPPVLK